MASDPLFEKIRPIISDIMMVPDEDITMASTPNTIEAWDSLRLLDMVLALESEFDVQFSPDEIMEMTTVARIVDVVALKAVEAA